MSWATKTGLVITCGQAVSIEEGQFQHTLQWSITRQGAIGLGESAHEMEFLRNFCPGARLAFGAGWVVPLWGLLDCIGDLVAALELVCSTAGLSLADFRLADFDSLEFRLSVMVLDAVARGIPLGDYMPGFAVGSAEMLQRVSNCPGWYEVPLVANLGEHGIVVWLRGECLVPVANGLICGLQPLSQISARWERRPKLPISRPELWVAPEWPGVDVANFASIDGRNIEPVSHEFGGRVWYDNAPGPNSPMPSEWLDPEPE